MISMGNALTAVIISGKVACSWKGSGVLEEKNVGTKLNSFERLSGSEKAAIKKAAKRYGEFPLIDNLT
jgi:hypothetical protein